MNCLKCGAENINGSSFCVKCGASLKETEPINSTSSFNEQMAQQPIEQMNQNIGIQQPVVNEPQINIQQPQANIQKSQANGNSVAPLNYFGYILAILLKPMKSFKEEESKLNDSKTSFLLTLVVTLAMTLINLLTTILNTVRVASYSWKSGGYTYSWKWENLKEIKWIQLIGKNFLIYIGIGFAIALVFYLGSLIIKKQLSFIKSLSISVTSIIPMVVAMLLSPLVGMIWSPLSMVFSAVGGVYSILLLYEFVNKELQLEGDQKVYFNLICFGILVVVGYYALMKLFMSTVTGGLSDIFDIFS